MKKVYLDYAATTPVDPRVLKTMMPYFSNKFANTMSVYSEGQESNEAVEKARKIIADLINTDTDRIVFTSSATESNNLVLKGIAFANRKKGKNHIIISEIEHDCVLESAKWLEKQGFKITRLTVDKYGFINLKDLTKAITKETVLVSIIHGNNEIGTIQDIEAVGKVCHQKGVYFHTDASQSLGKTSIDVKKMDIDLLTASSHKVYGPKGAACLYINKKVIIEPILHGGGHEGGLRSSTVNVPAIVGFGKAVEILSKEGKQENKKLTELRDLFINKILKSINGSKLNGHPVKRLCNNINISIPGAEGEALTMELDFEGVNVSTGSACSSRTLMPSHVLTAIGLPPEQAHGSLRISLGRFTKKEDILYTVKILMKVVNKLRRISPFEYDRQ